MVDWWWLLIAGAGGFILGAAIMSAIVAGSIEDEKAGIKDG